MAGNVPFPANDWTAARRTMAGAFKWPRELAVHDLRYWAIVDEPRPSMRVLAGDWSWAKTSVHSLIRESDGPRLSVSMDGQLDMRFHGSHDDLVERAQRWMNNTLRCKAVVTERPCWALPYTWDAVGLLKGLSVAVECKRTRSDFLADKRKWIAGNPEKAFGDLRWYFVRPGIVSLDEIPDDWGLAVCGERIVRVLRKPTPVPRVDHEHELLFYGAVIEFPGRR